MKFVKSIPFALGFGLGFSFLLFLNLYLLSRSHELPGGGLCMDCGLPVGFPFTLYRTETIMGGEGFVASGVFANGVMAIVSGLILGWMFQSGWRAFSSVSKVSRLG